MDLNDINEGSIVFLRFMRFPDNNQIDCRLNGRPYLFYKIVDDKAYLFALTSNTAGDSKFYYEIERKGLNGNKRKSYVNLRNLFIIDLDELLLKINELHNEDKFKRINRHENVTINDMEKITEKLATLIFINSYKNRWRNLV